MAATVRAYLANSSGPTFIDVDNADAGSIKFGRDDLQTSASTLPIPTATGTNYSYLKYLLLYVTIAGATTITNRRIAWATAPATGINAHFQNQATYTQNNGTQGVAAGNYPTNNVGTNGATPSGYTALTTSPQLWDNTGVSTAGTGKNGNYAQTVLGVDFSFIGGGGATSIPTIALTYDEA